MKNNKGYLFNNFNKEKNVIDINNNNRHQNILRNRKELKIPIGREKSINYKNGINKNAFIKKCISIIIYYCIK